MKRILVTLLVLVIALTGTIAFGEDVVPICEEPIVVKVASIDFGDDYNNQWLTKYIEEKLGIKLEFEMYSPSDWSTQFTLMLATQELPDMFMGANVAKGDINKYGADGILLNMADYADLMPNYAALAEKYPLWDAYQKTTDGAIYGLSRLFPSRIGLATGLCNFIDNEWLENVGLEMPTTIDEFYAVLKAFKEQDANGNGDPNDEIPLVVNFNGRSRIEWMLMAAYGFYTNNPNVTMQYDENGQVYLAQTTQRYKDYLKFIRKLYAEELLDPTCFIMTDDEVMDKVRSNRAGVFSDYMGLMGATNANDGSVYQDYSFIVGLKSAYNDKIDFSLGNCGYAEGSRTFISANTKYPEQIVRLVDYFLSWDSILLCDYGVEGETFNYVTDQFGNEVPSFDGYWEENYESASAFQKALKLDEGLKIIRTSAINQIVENASDEVLDQMIYEDQTYTYTVAAAQEKALRTADALVSPMPDLLFTENENATRSTLVTDISSYLNNMKASFITGEIDIDKGWDNYLEQLNSMGLQELLSITQAAYDRFSK